jgi:hypothetical protein
MLDTFVQDSSEYFKWYVLLQIEIVLKIQLNPRDEEFSLYIPIATYTHSGTLPGKKETYMESLNDFIETHLTEGIAFLERLSAPNIQERAVDVEGQMQVPQNVYDNALIYLAKHIKLTEAKLKKSFEGMHGAEVREIIWYSESPIRSNHATVADRWLIEWTVFLMISLGI